MKTAAVLLPTRLDASRGEHALARITRLVAEAAERGWATRLALLVILVGAAWLRLSAVGLGRPFVSFQPDEDANLLRALTLASGHLNPHFFYYPDLLWLVLAGVYRVVFWFGHGLGLLRDWDEFTRLRENSPLLFFVGRVVGVAFGTATVGCLYLVGRRLFSPGHGLLAAGLLTGAFLHVRDSALTTVDAPMTFFVVLALLGAAGILHEGRGRDYALAAVAAGLATATKYNGVLVVVALVVAHVLRMVRTGVPLYRAVTASRLLGAGVLAGFVFLALNSFILLDWREAFGGPDAWGSLSWQWQYIHTGEWVDVGPAWWYHLTVSLRYGVGLALLGLGLGGVLLALWRLEVGGLMLLSFAVAFFAALGGLKAVFVRYMTPLVPVLCLFAAGALLSMTQRLPWPRMVPGVTAALALAVLLEPLDAGASYARMMHHLDTRTQASEFIRTTLPPDTEVATYGPSVTWRSTIPRWLPTIYAVPESQAWEKALAALRSRNIRYLMTHHSGLDVFSPRIPALEDALRRSATLVQEFSPYRRGAQPTPLYDRMDAYYFPVGRFRGIVEPGPLIRLYHLEDVPSSQFPTRSRRDR